MGGFQDMKIPNFHRVLFKRKRLNSQKKFEREPTEKKFQKIQTPMFEKIKSLPKQRKFFLRGRFSERKFKWPLFKENHKVFDKNQIKNFGVSQHLPP